MGYQPKTTPSTPSRGPPDRDGDGFPHFILAPMHSRRGARTTHRGPSSTQRCWGPRRRMPLTRRCFLHRTRGRAPSRKAGPGRSACSECMPPGMTLSSSGLISGKAQASGPYTFGVVATDNSTYAQAPPAHPESDHQRLTHSAVYSSNRMRRRVTVCPRHHHRCTGGWRSCRLQQPQSFSRLAHCCRRR